MSNVKINRSGTIKKRRGVNKYPEAVRNKYWDELDDKEKLIRCAEIIDLLWNRMKELVDTVERLKGHGHHDGKITVPFDFDKRNEFLLGYRYDPFYRRKETSPVQHGL